MDEVKTILNDKDSKFESESPSTENIVKVEVEQKKTSFLKKLALIGSAILAVIVAIFSFGRRGDSYYKEKIEEEKRKDKELKEKADKIGSEIKELEKKSEEVEIKIKEKEKEFTDIVINTNKEKDIFQKEKEDILVSKDNTDANIEWVKTRFGGNVKKED